MNLKPSFLRRISNNERVDKILRMCRSQRNSGTWHESKRSEGEKSFHTQTERYFSR